MRTRLSQGRAKQSAPDLTYYLMEQAQAETSIKDDSLYWMHGDSLLAIVTVRWVSLTYTRMSKATSTHRIDRPMANWYNTKANQRIRTRERFLRAGKAPATRRTDLRRGERRQRVPSQGSEPASSSQRRHRPEAASVSGAAHGRSEEGDGRGRLDRQQVHPAQHNHCRA